MRNAVMVGLIVGAALVAVGCPRPAQPPQSLSTPPPPPAAPAQEKPTRKLTLRPLTPESKGELVLQEPRTGLTWRAQGMIIVAVREDGIGFGFTLTAISPGVYALGVAVANRSTRPLVIPWDQVSLTGPDRLSRRVVHRGVKLVDRGGSMPPTTIPPGGAVEDFVFPADAISYESGRYGGWRYAAYFERLGQGQEVMLYLPVKLGEESKAYSFKFSALVEMVAP